MSEFSEQIKAAYSTVDATAESAPNNEGAGAPPVENVTTQKTAPEAAPETAQSAETTTVPETANTTEPPAPVFDWGHLSERTEGVIKDEESFTSIFEKVKGYDDLSTKYTELESNQVKFANPLVEGLNNLIAQGANQSQIETYWAINKIGDFSAMDPREALISHSVLLNNTDREVAAYRIDSKFDFSQHDEDSIEYKALKDEQRIEANKAIKDLEQFKKENSTVSNPEKEAAEQARLSQIAEKAEWDKTVKSVAPILAKEAPKSFNLGTGESAISVNYSEEFSNTIPSLVEKFFEASGANPNDKSSQEAVNKFVEARYKIENFDTIVSDLLNKKESEVTERITSKFTNPGGKPREEINPNSASTEMSHEQWLNKKFGGR